MMRSAPLLTARLFTRMPEDLHHRGPPSDWARMTRPGQAIHSFLEGAFFDGDGALWLCDVAYGRIFRIGPGGGWTLGQQYAGEPHSMRFAPDGRPVIADYRRGLITLGPDGPVPLAATAGDGPFLGLSDMTYGPDGTLWFTDSGRSSLSDPVGRVYARSADGTLRQVLGGIAYPNGIAVSPDGRFVYVAATRSNAVLRFAAALPASDAPMLGTFLHLSGGLGPDGLATNALGWLAVAQAQAGRAYVVDALGDPVAEVRLPSGLWTTSVAFDPTAPKRLYVVDAEFGAVFVADL
ncbi:SMP-30/gluconolactonase/LRE family protein [Acuticoccus sediminis]|nr:SMP-30/gluconolactonase/LRE family protein [Acuticoccus sediminis]